MNMNLSSPGDSENRVPGSKNAPTAPDKRRRVWSYIFRLIFSVVLICLIIRAVNLDKVLAIVSGVNPWILLTACLTVLAGAFPSAYAWKLLLEVQGFTAPYLRIVYMNLVGFFFNSYLPTGIGGDVWRGFTLSRVSGHTGESVASVIMERLVAFGSIVLLGGVSFLFNINRFREAGILAPVALFFGIITAVFLGMIFLGPYFLDKGQDKIKKFLPLLPETGLGDGLARYREKPLTVLGALLMTSLSPLLECLTYILIINALKLNVSYLPVFILVPLLRFINHIPVSINSIGTQDLALLLFWRPLGLSAPEAFSISLLSHLLRLAAGGIGGILYVVIPWNNQSCRDSM